MHIQKHHFCQLSAFKTQLQLQEFQTRAFFQTQANTCSTSVFHQTPSDYAWTDSLDQDAPTFSYPDYAVALKQLLTQF